MSQHLSTPPGISPAPDRSKRGRALCLLCLLALSWALALASPVWGQARGLLGTQLCSASTSIQPDAERAGTAHALDCPLCLPCPLACSAPGFAAGAPQPLWLGVSPEPPVPKPGWRALPPARAPPFA